MLSSRVNGSRHGVETVRIRGADHRAEIVVAYREGVSHGVVKRKVGAGVITHGEDGIVGIDREARGHKAIHCAAVPALVLWHPVVRDVVGACCVRLGGVEMEWQQYAGRWVRGICRVGLLECRTLVRESTHAAVASEIMVEGTIFLDEDDDVVDVSQFGANGWSGNGGSIATAASRQKRGRDLCCS